MKTGFLLLLSPAKQIRLNLRNKKGLGKQKKTVFWTLLKSFPVSGLFKF